MDATVSKVSDSGSKIEVKWSASMVNTSLDGDVCGKELISFGELTLSGKDGSVAVYARGGLNAVSTSWPNMPATAVAVVRGMRGSKEIVQPISKSTYDLILQLFAEAKKLAEADCQQPVATKKEEANVFVVNPRYAHMSPEQIRAAERRYYLVNNEGGEGYNPYRDNLFSQ
jgi:hypothetical protein